MNAGVDKLATEPEEGRFGFVGGRLCLDFANKVSSYRSEEPREYLVTYADLAEWGTKAGIITTEKTKRLLNRAANLPTQAAAVLKEAVELREAIHSIFSAVVEDQQPGA